MSSITELVMCLVQVSCMRNKKNKNRIRNYTALYSLARRQAFSTDHIVCIIIMPICIYASVKLIHLLYNLSLKVDASVARFGMIHY